MKVSVLQLTSQLSAQENLDKIDSLIPRAKEQGSQVVFLPEVFLSMNDGNGPTPYLVEAGNEWEEKIKSLAKKHQVYLLGGTCATKVGDKIMNRAYNISPDGEIINTYDKRNVFKCTIEGKEIDEGKVYSKGDKECIVDIDKLKIGINVCVDLRYPELFQSYRNQGCNIISVSSAFTKKTGELHWNTLLRARAIENQCYIVAANQYGKHNDVWETYGHSVIYSPWGDLLVDLKEGESVGTAEVDLAFMEEVRKRITL